MVLRTYRRFRRLWLGQVVSVIGDGVHRLAVLWWAKTTYGGASALIAIAMCTTVPLVLAGPFGGYLADRCDRRLLLVASNAARLVITLALAWLVTGSGGHLAAVGALTVAAALATAVFDPTYAAAVPALVPQAELAAANGLNLANSALAALAGPLLGGVLVAGPGVAAALLVDAASFLWAALLAITVAVPSAGGPGAGGSEGGGGPVLRQLASVPAVRRIVALASVLNLVVAPLAVLMVSLAVDAFSAGAASFGALDAALGVGMLAGALGAGRLVDRRAALTVSLAGFGVAVVLIGVAPFAMAIVTAAAAGAALAVANTSLITTMQCVVPASLHGRAFGVLGSLSEALRPLGLLMAGPLLAGLGVRASFVAVGISVVAAAVGWAPAVPHGVVADPSESAVSGAAVLGLVHEPGQ